MTTKQLLSDNAWQAVATYNADAFRVEEQAVLDDVLATIDQATSIEEIIDNARDTQQHLNYVDACEKLEIKAGYADKIYKLRTSDNSVMLICLDRDIRYDLSK
jgi:hypothetical protein